MDFVIGELVWFNESLDFICSNYFVLGYDWSIVLSWWAKVEMYYQVISDVLVQFFVSSFFMFNVGVDFVFLEIGCLVNEGIGMNYGLEFILEKFFSSGYYGLLIVLFFDFRYEGSDEIECNIVFNNGYVVNFLVGKEFKIGKDKCNVLIFDMCLSNVGGCYYILVDLEVLRVVGVEVLQEGVVFSECFDFYFCFDLKFGYQFNSKRKCLFQQFFIDLQNIINNDNIFDLCYNLEINNVDWVL